jgi:hypothetical protein
MSPPFTVAKLGATWDKATVLSSETPMAAPTCSPVLTSAEATAAAGLARCVAVLLGGPRNSLKAHRP